MAETNELNDSPSTVTNSNSDSKLNLLDYKESSKEYLKEKSDFKNKSIIEKITETIECIIEENIKTKTKNKVNIFYSIKEPSISLEDYIIRIQKYKKNAK